MLLESGERPRYIWISGPAKLRVLEGKMEINGVAHEPGLEVVIHRDRSYVVKLEPKGTVEVEAPGEPSLRDAVEEEIRVLEAWKALAEYIGKSIEKGEEGRVIIVGGVDVGKTTLTTLLANSMLERGVKPFIVDTDLGQANIGLPGFVTGSLHCRPTVWHRQLKPEFAFFVGSITPSGFEERVVAGALFVVERALERHGVRPILVDTDGWFRGAEALAYKLKLISALKPMHVVHIKDEDEPSEVEERVRAFCKGIRAEHHVLQAPPARKKRSRVDRIFLRGEKLVSPERRRRAFICPLETPILGTLTLGVGSPLSDSERDSLSRELGVRVLYGERQDRRIILLVKDHAKHPSMKNAIAIPIHRLKGMILGLADESGNHVGWGIVVGFDETRRAFVIETEHSGDISHAISGMIKFDGTTVYMERTLW
uniref:polynucleotide 5'-hydroxyl-kinase n=1 Tax=Fervidicoccus fontis TaxID=683846 RepID=A0A7J3ZJR4_9CREN